MRSPDGGWVAAELLLRQPSPEKASQVAQYLKEHGVNVTRIGAASISIRCEHAQFERLFNTRLRKAEARSSGAGVFDYGPARRESYQAEEPIQVPEPLSE